MIGEVSVKLGAAESKNALEVGANGSPGMNPG
jgi:hypothetical protein